MTDTTTQRLACIVLAAGKGTRMKSRLPKVLHKIAGEPMLGHVLQAVAPLNPDQIVVVVAPGQEDVAAYVAPHQTVVQAEALGTAHAVQAAAGVLEDFTGTVLVVYGDEPLVETENLRKLVAARDDASDPAVVMMGRRTCEPGPYGRLVIGPSGLERIVEALDATPEERAIDLIWTGNLAADGRVFFPFLDHIDNNNAKGEYYLTAIVAKARAVGRACGVLDIGFDETIGVNSRAELAVAEALVQKRLRSAAMAGGATLVDPDTVYFNLDTRLGQDVVIGPGVVFGPGVVVEDEVEIKAWCHLEGATLRRGSSIGPFARLRPGTVIGPDAHIGNFVELKNAQLAEGVKAGHLTYLGDVEVGTKTNIGAGTITVNYNGFKKSRTSIGENAFVGSNSTLIAPLTLGAGSMVTAGSTITRDVAADAMAFGRAGQVDKPGRAARFRDLMRLKSAKPKFCLLFDLDGTLVNTDHLHMEAFQEVWNDQGRDISGEEYEAQFMGRPNAAIMQSYFPDEPAERHVELADRKEALFRAKVRQLEPTLGLGALLDWAEKHDCPFAIVTNAPRRNAQLMLNALGIAERFDHVIIGEELAHSKPHPLPYLTGLEKLGGTAARAVAFEDSVSGARAAIAAGIYTVGMRTTLKDEQLLAVGVKRVISDFHDEGLLQWLRDQVTN